MESTKSPSVELLGQQQPRLKVTPTAAAHDAADVIEMLACYGLVLDPWQQMALQCGLRLGDDGRWAADTVAICAPRQSGKGCLIEARALSGVMLFGEHTVAVSAHEARTTRLSFERVLAYLESYDDLRRRVRSVQRWVGREQIRLQDGSLIVFPARSRGALRGYTVDSLILDEAQYLTNALFEAVLPTLSARPRMQTRHLGTVPTHLGDGEVFGRLRAAALADSGDGRLCYLEWSADPGCDLDDREQWAQANPVLGRRISVDAVAAERRELSAEGFARERLGLWPVDRLEHVFPLEVWTALAAQGPLDGTPPSALAVDASPGRLLAVAGAWALDDSVLHVELLATDYVADPLQALQWVVVMWVILSSRCLGCAGVEPVEQAVEDFLAADLALAGGVVALPLQGGSELDGGDEEAAGFADRLEVAVHVDRSSAVAVAEHASVHLGAELAHLPAFVVGGELAGLAVEGLDFLGDGEVFVGDGLVGDTGVNHCHG